MVTVVRPSDRPSVRLRRAVRPGPPWWERKGRMWITPGFERLHLPTLTSDRCDKLGDTERESGENCNNNNNNNNKSDPRSVVLMRWRGVVCFAVVSSSRAAGEQERWGLGLLVCARLAMQPMVARYNRRLIGRRAFFRVNADAVCSL